MYRKGKVRCQPDLKFEGEFEFIALFSTLENGFGQNLLRIESRRRVGLVGAMSKRGSAC
jgi:hypothetical protein